MTTALNIHILCESNRLFYYSNLHDCISATPYNNLILLLEKYYFGIQKKKERSVIGLKKKKIFLLGESEEWLIALVCRNKMHRFMFLLILLPPEYCSNRKPPQSLPSSN